MCHLDDQYKQQVKQLEDEESKISPFNESSHCDGPLSNGLKLQACLPQDDDCQMNDNSHNDTDA